MTTRPGTERPVAPSSALTEDRRVVVSPPPRLRLSNSEHELPSRTSIVSDLESACALLTRKSSGIAEILEYVTKAKRRYESAIDERELELKVEIEKLVRQEKAAVLDREKVLLLPLLPQQSRCAAALVEVTRMLEKVNGDGESAFDEARATLKAIESTLTSGIEPDRDWPVDLLTQWEAIPSWRVVVAPPEREVEPAQRNRKNKSFLAKPGQYATMMMMRRPGSSKARKHKRDPLDVEEARGAGDVVVQGEVDVEDSATALDHDHDPLDYLQLEAARQRLVVQSKWRANTSERAPSFDRLVDITTTSAVAGGAGTTSLFDIAGGGICYSASSAASSSCSRNRPAGGAAQLLSAAALNQRTRRPPDNVRTSGKMQSEVAGGGGPSSTFGTTETTRAASGLKETFGASAVSFYRGSGGPGGGPRPSSSKARKHKRVLLHPEEDQFVFYDNEPQQKSDSDDEDNIRRFIGRNLVGGSSSSSGMTKSFPLKPGAPGTSISSAVRRGTSETAAIFRGPSAPESGAGALPSCSSLSQQHKKRGAIDLTEIEEYSEDGSRDADRDLIEDFFVKGGSNVPARAPPSPDDLDDENQNDLEDEERTAAVADAEDHTTSSASGSASSSSSTTTRSKTGRLISGLPQFQPPQRGGGCHVPLAGRERSVPGGAGDARTAAGLAAARGTIATESGSESTCVEGSLLHHRRPPPTSTRPKTARPSSAPKVISVQSAASTSDDLVTQIKRPTDDVDRGAPTEFSVADVSSGSGSEEQYVQVQLPTPQSSAATSSASASSSSTSSACINSGGKIKQIQEPWSKGLMNSSFMSASSNNRGSPTLNKATVAPYQPPETFEKIEQIDFRASAEDVIARLKANADQRAATGHGADGGQSVDESAGHEHNLEPQPALAHHLPVREDTHRNESVLGQHDQDSSKQTDEVVDDFIIYDDVDDHDESSDGHEQVIKTKLAEYYSRRQTQEALKEKVQQLSQIAAKGNKNRRPQTSKATSISIKKMAMKTSTSGPDGASSAATTEKIESRFVLADDNGGFVEVDAQHAGTEDEAPPDPTRASSCDVMMEDEQQNGTVAAEEQVAGGGTTSSLISRSDSLSRASEQLADIFARQLASAAASPQDGAPVSAAGPSPDASSALRAILGARAPPARLAGGKIAERDFISSSSRNVDVVVAGPRAPRSLESSYLAPAFSTSWSTAGRGEQGGRPLLYYNSGGGSSSSSSAAAEGAPQQKSQGVSSPKRDIIFQRAQQDTFTATQAGGPLPSTSTRKIPIVDLGTKQTFRCYVPAELQEAGLPAQIQVAVEDSAASSSSTASSSKATVGQLVRELVQLHGRPGAAGGALLTTKKLTLCLRTHEKGAPIWLCDNEIVEDVLRDWKAVAQPGPDWPRLYVQTM
mmetsp:Transcript_16422/g.40583  ORF Transcript_16422/g.40583 Transcript_16422/m.40583 type:complete len:1389 (-) Transcript_16422:532-4698(-)